MREVMPQFERPFMVLDGGQNPLLIMGISKCCGPSIFGISDCCC